MYITVGGLHAEVRGKLSLCTPDFTHELNCGEPRLL